MAFHFQGPLQASKSLMNRALLVQTFFPDLKILGQSNCDDVRHMKLAIVSLIRQTPIDCGEAGTVFRFMGLRSSREIGTFTLKGSARLMKRPHDEMAFILSQLGVNIDFLTDGVVIHSQGWKKPLFPVKIPRSRSSQFASGLLLSAWDLPFDLEFEFSGQSVSEGYWQMSVHIAQSLGMQMLIEQGKIKIPAGQKMKAKEISIEPDYSSMFAVVACALVDGHIEIQGVGEQSFQPDYIFLELIKIMGASLTLSPSGVLTVQKAKQLLPIEASFRNCPDLFPVMAALCSFAHGTSVLKEAPQLALKESDRLKNTQSLLTLAGVDSVVKGDGLLIHGRGINFIPKDFVFEPDQDHRMAMAAAVFKLRERKIEIQNTEVVRKSFPEFWSVIGL